MSGEGVNVPPGADLQSWAESGVSADHSEEILDAPTLRWAEDMILQGIRLWKERRNKLARGTDRSSCDALCEVLQGLASVIGGKAEELTIRERTGDNFPHQRTGEETV
jgi:hypothetical protein